MNTFKAKKANQKYKRRIELIRYKKERKAVHLEWLTKEAMKREIQYVNDKMAEDRKQPSKMGGVIEYIPEKSNMSIREWIASKFWG